MVLEVGNLFVQDALLPELLQLFARDLEEVGVEVRALEVVACAAGEEEELVRHVVGAYLVDLEELSVDGLVGVDVLGVYAVLADVLKPLNVVLQLVVQAHVLLLFLLSVALLLLLRWLLRLAGRNCLALLLYLCLLGLSTCFRYILWQDWLYLLFFWYLLGSEFASAKIELLDLVFIGRSSVSRVTFGLGRCGKLRRRMYFGVGILARL